MKGRSMSAANPGPGDGLATTAPRRYITVMSGCKAVRDVFTRDERTYAVFVRAADATRRTRLVGDSAT